MFNVNHVMYNKERTEFYKYRKCEFKKMESCDEQH